MKYIMVTLILTLFVSSTWAEVFRDDFNDGDLQGWVVWREASVELMFPPIIANGVKIGLRAHAIDENWQIPQLQYDLSYTFFLGRHTDGRKGIGASIWYVHKIMKRAEMDRVQFINNVKLPEMAEVEMRNKLLEFSPFAFEMDKWYRLKVIARDNRFQVFVDKKKMLDFLDNTYTEGRVYLSSGLGNRVHFDDFEVRWGAALAVQPQRKLATTWGQIKHGFR